MSWTPPHNLFTTFVKDNNNIYIKCADGSWVVITLGPSPVGPYGGGGRHHSYRYEYLEQTWEILGKRAIKGDITSKIIGEPSEINVFGIRILGNPADEVRNVFTCYGSIAVFDEIDLKLFGAEAEYLEKSFYSFGKKAERELKDVPVFGKKTKENIYEGFFSGIKTKEELIELLVNGSIAEKTTSKLDLVLAGKIGELSSIGSSISGNKTMLTEVEKGVVGEKSFTTLLNLLLTEI